MLYHTVPNWHMRNHILPHHFVPFCTILASPPWHVRHHIILQNTVPYCTILASLPWHVRHVRPCSTILYYIGQSAMAPAVPYRTKLYCTTTTPYSTKLVSLVRHVSHVRPFSTLLYRTHCTILYLSTNFTTLNQFSMPICQISPSCSMQCCCISILTKGKRLSWKSTSVALYVIICSLVAINWMHIFHVNIGYDMKCSLKLPLHPTHGYLDLFACVQTSPILSRNM